MVTRVQWDQEWDGCFKRLRAKGYGPLEAQRMAREITTARNGPQPPEAPLWLRFAVKFAAKKLFGLLGLTEGQMRIDKYLEAAAVSALLQAILVAAPIFADGKVTGAEGLMVLGGFLGGMAMYMKQHPPVDPQP